MDAASLRYGIIGTGMMGIEHLNNLLHVDGAEVTALCDPHAPSLEAAAAHAPGAATFGHHREVLEAGCCDLHEDAP